MPNYGRRGGARGSRRTGPRMGRPTPGRGRRARQRRFSRMRGPAGGTGGVRIPDLPPGLGQGEIVFEGGASNDKSTMYICPQGSHGKLSEKCVKATEGQQALISNGSSTMEKGNFPPPIGRGRGGRNG